MNFKTLIIILMLLISNSCEWESDGNALLDLKRPVKLFSLDKKDAEVSLRYYGRDNEDFKTLEHKNGKIEFVAWSKASMPFDQSHYHTAHLLEIKSKKDIYVGQFTAMEIELDYTIVNTSERHNSMDIFRKTIFWKYSDEDPSKYREIYEGNLDELTDEVEALNFKIEFVLTSGITSLLNNEHVDNTATYHFNSLNIFGKFD